MEDFLIYGMYDMFGIHISYYIQRIILPFITNAAFPFLMVVLLINRNKWKRPVIYILIAYWFFTSIYYAFSYIIFLIQSYDVEMYWCDTKNMLGWYLQNSLPDMFWYLGEIIGDWYLFLRTKAIIGNKKTTFIFISCIIYNLTKILYIVSRFIITPTCVFDEYFQSDKTSNYKNVNIYSVIFLFVIQISSVIYDLIIIHYMRKNLFEKLRNKESSKNNGFIEKFKKTSEYRIIISLLMSILLLILLFFSIVLIIMRAKEDDQNNMTIDYTLGSTDLRNTFVLFNYIFMYIDQILLRYYAERNNPKLKISSTNSVMYKGEIISPNEIDSSSYDINQLLLNKSFSYAKYNFSEEYSNYLSDPDYNSSNDLLNYKSFHNTSTDDLINKSFHNTSNTSNDNIINKSFHNASTDNLISKSFKNKSNDNYLNKSFKNKSNDNYLNKSFQITSSDNYLNKSFQNTSTDNLINKSFQNSFSDNYFNKSFQNKSNDKTINKSFQNTSNDKTINKSFQNTSNDNIINKSFHNASSDNYLNKSFQNNSNDNYLNKSFQYTSNDITMNKSLQNKSNDNIINKSFQNKSNDNYLYKSFQNKSNDNYLYKSFQNTSNDKIMNKSFQNKSNDNTINKSFQNKSNDNYLNKSFHNTSN